ncbi:B12-binding domain-containing radical SAM protein [Methanocrinis sp.]|uniref:B12-binding domain-containing radical SAM protein n=1 Tax=Methanocrinis sp. TaxID=3101522 RepID=UPI003D09F31C
MTSVLLIYPYFKPRHKNSSFLFPPLGLGYIASSLRMAGHEVEILDCTFLGEEEARERAVASGADLLGIYSMVSMQNEALKFARLLRKRSELLVAGGPQPSSDPVPFLDDFDLAVIGEGEDTILEILRSFEDGSDIGSVKGIAYRRGRFGGSAPNPHALKDLRGVPVVTEPRPHRQDLDLIPFPARDLFPNDEYISYWRRRFGRACAAVITTRGCPFSCEFCSRSVFGTTYRERSPGNVLYEVEEVLDLGYDQVHFADDVFTLNRDRVLDICQKIRDDGPSFGWECLGRVDSIDPAVALAMREAGCERVLFGIESGSDPVLGLMKKRTTAEDAKRAVSAARDAGLKTGAFFILCYPGETDDTVLETLRFATRLPLDYLSFTMPHPLPGTPLYERVRGEMNSDASDDVAVFDAEFSKRKMKFAVLKGEVGFKIQRRLGRAAPVVLVPFEAVTDGIFRRMV